MINAHSWPRPQEACVFPLSLLDSCPTMRRICLAGQLLPERGRATPRAESSLAKPAKHQTPEE